MPIPPSTATLERPILRESVYERLRDWIVTGVLEPGEQLRDQELALRLGVSRTPVREALRRLEDEGLVETAKNRWTRVRPVELDETRQIYPIILALEQLALELALPRLREADLKALQRYNRRFAQAIAGGDAALAAEMDIAFHGVLVERSENPELIGILRSLKHKYRRLEQLFFGHAALGRDSPRQHQQLIEALSRRDLAAAQRILKQNWSRKEPL
ncbi:MAG: GntR family transcriptional regulator [Meiothermus sp.]|uniref:GntR family transcriptional regulator n=1 Tax=Meiothermus sp. TaxID=1955249 RepID=UPI0025F30EE1|nr:GntR family transcriptional regulator [Meiothermus sp.]MCS7068577.1 GntR family transcriptional regulator [Meiothermus sp.]MDW8424855.1 GntR family transcriptional regulator [Meiothermus sp.]